MVVDLFVVLCGVVRYFVLMAPGIMGRSFVLWQRRPTATDDSDIKDFKCGLFPLLGYKCRVHDRLPHVSRLHDGEKKNDKK